jgi:hypothetical protein
MRHGGWLVLAASLWCLAAMGRTTLAQEGPCWGRGGTYGTYIPDATGEPPPTRYITTQGGVHLRLPRHPKPPCQRPASICFKPKMWRFSQVFYQLHHEAWHGVTDPCWLMDPDCCGTSCQHQKSFGLWNLFPWVKRNGRGCRGPVSPCQQCGMQSQHAAPADCDGCQGEGVGPAVGVEVEGEGEETSPTLADPPVEHPQAAQRAPLRSVLLRRE